MLSFETTCAFFVASLLMAMTPGPDVIIVLTQSSLYGMRAGVLTTLGLMTGLLGHTLAVALGVAVLFQTSEAAFTALKFLGAAYLLYLAWQSFRSGVFRAFLTQSLFPGYGTLYRRGFLSNITNPKVTLFCLAVLPQFVEPERGHPTLQILSLGGLYELACLIVFTAIAALGGRMATWFNRSDRAQMLMNRIAGCIFLGLRSCWPLLHVDFRNIPLQTEAAPRADSASGPHRNQPFRLRVIHRKMASQTMPASVA